MNTQAAFAAHWAALATAFLIAWLVLALIVALVYARLCRFADGQAREDAEMRELLWTLGRERREAHLAEMIANADAMVAEVNDARAIRRILRDVRRAPVLGEPDIDRIGEVG